MKAACPLIVILLISACGRDEEITRVRVPKEENPMAAAPMPAGQAPAKTLKWITPSGWKELPGSGMRVATMVPPGSGKIEMTVTAFPGDVGGELANVNRWRGQIGLKPLEEAGLIKARQSLVSKAGPIALYDFTSEGAAKTRLVAGAIFSGDSTWFFKLMGDEEPVAAARPAFVSLLRGLRAAK